MDVVPRCIALRASLNEFLQKAKAHGSDRVLTCSQHREQLLLGLDNTAAIEIEFLLQMAGAAGEMRLTSLALDTIPSPPNLSLADGRLELLARTHGQRPRLFRGQGVPRPVPIVGRGPWVGCGQLVVSGLSGESGSFGYMFGRQGFANVLFSSWRGGVSVAQFARSEACAM